MDPLILREHKSKADLLQAMRAERAKLDALFERVPDARMAIPGAMGDWTAKDMLAHLLCYETWITAQVSPSLRADLPPFDGIDHMDDTEERNQFYHRLYQDLSVQEVRAEAKRVFDHLLAAVEAASEEALNAPVAFDQENNLNSTTWDSPPAPVLWPLWRWIAYESYEHYVDHIPDLEAWASQE